MSIRALYLYRTCNTPCKSIAIPVDCGLLAWRVVAPSVRMQRMPGKVAAPSLTEPHLSISEPAREIQHTGPESPGAHRIYAAVDPRPRYAFAYSQLLGSPRKLVLRHELLASTGKYLDM